MRCHYLSDLHLESQAYPWPVPTGDVLIIAGDLCHARCLDPQRTDKYSTGQRSRVMRFMDSAIRNFAHVLLVPGKHDHYDGIFDDTAALLRLHLPGATVLDGECVEIGGVRFFGATLQTDFNGRSKASLDAVRRGMGEYFFVKKRTHGSDGREILARFRPEDALEAFDASWRGLHRCLAEANARPTVVVTHHAPSRKGLDARFASTGLDAAYASGLSHRRHGRALERLRLRGQGKCVVWIFERRLIRGMNR